MTPPRRRRKIEQEFLEELEEYRRLRALLSPRQGEGRKARRPARRFLSYQEWTKGELYERARRLGVEGRSTMAKDELIEAIRSHH